MLNRTYCHPTVKEEWIDRECSQAIEAKNYARLQQCEYNAKRNAYCGTEKSAAIKPLRENEVRSFIEWFNANGNKPQNGFVKGKTGNQINETQVITVRWVECFSGLLNEDNDGGNPLQ